MFNVMVTAGDNAWEEGVYVWDRSRILEYTDGAIREPLKGLSADALEELANLPTLFMYERYAEGTQRVGAIKRVQQRGSEIRIIFEFDDTVGPLNLEQIEALQWDLGLAEFEFTRTHWAVKKGDLYAILREAGHLLEPVAAAAAPAAEAEPPPAVDVTPAKVFLVHGRDEAAKHTVARFLERRVRLDVIILSERPNRGRSILTKFRDEADGASFAIVLMTPDDLGHLRPGLLPADVAAPAPQPRPRQNVIFELGFFIGQLGADRVCALVPPGVERPSDYDGIVYVPLDDQDGWQKKLVTELHAANVPVSATWWQA
ncbi:TIR domain-containing protein [Methylobacterium sp. CM6247]